MIYRVLEYEKVGGRVVLRVTAFYALVDRVTAIYRRRKYSKVTL